MKKRLTKANRDWRTPTTYFEPRNKKKTERLSDSRKIVQGIKDEDWNYATNVLHNTLYKRLQDKEEWQRGMRKGGEAMERDLFSD